MLVIPFLFLLLSFQRDVLLLNHQLLLKTSGLQVSLRRVLWTNTTHPPNCAELSPTGDFGRGIQHVCYWAQGDQNPGIFALRPTGLPAVTPHGLVSHNKPAILCRDF